MLHGEMRAGCAAMLLMASGPARAAERVDEPPAGAKREASRRVERAEPFRPAGAALEFLDGDRAGYVTRAELEESYRALVERLERERERSPRPVTPTFTDAG